MIIGCGVIFAMARLNEIISGTTIVIAIVILIIAIFILFVIKKQKESRYFHLPNEKNPFEGKKVIFIEDDNDEVNADGVRGHLVAKGSTNYKPGFYVKYIKRLLDLVVSFLGLIVLSPVFLLILILIKIDDPGPAYFTQKRVGQNKMFFKVHKFRSMKMNTPRDIPTHMLKKPDQYISKVGKFLRSHSLDELPQIWDVFIGNMSIIGPRPALWNQDFLTAERDRYNANDVKPGLSGVAQLKGRDSISIPEKAKLDGEYVKRISFLLDLKCFFGTFKKILKDDSIVEGELTSENEEANKMKESN